MKEQKPSKNPFINIAKKAVTEQGKKPPLKPAKIMGVPKPMLRKTGRGR